MTGKEKTKVKYENFEAKQAKLKAEADAIRDEFLEGARKTKTGKVNLSAGVSYAKLNWKGVQRMVDAYLFDFEGKLDTVLQHVDAATRKALIAKLDPSGALAAEKQQTMHQQQALRGKIESAVGMGWTDVFKLVVSASKDKSMTVEFTNTHGEPDKLELSPMQALGITLDAQDPKNHAGFHTNGWTLKNDVPSGKTTSLIHQIEHQLDPRLFKIGVAVQKFFHEDNLPILQKAFYDDTGKELVLKTNGSQFPPLYSGKVVRSGEFASSSYDAFVNSFGGTLHNFVGEISEPKSTIEQVNNAHRIEMRNPLVSALQAISDTAHYANLTELSKLYNVTFNDGNVQKAIAIQHGAQMNEALGQHAGYLTKGAANVNNKWLSALNSWAAKYGHAVLSLDWTRHPRHVSTFMNYALADIGDGKFMPSKALVGGIFSYFKDPASINDHLYNNSTKLRNKYADSGNALAGDLRKADLRAMEDRKLAEFLGAPLTLGAQLADQMGMHSIIRHLESKGMSSAEAMKVAEAALEKTQYSNSADQLSVFALNPNTTLFSKFTQYPTKLFQLQAVAVRDAVNAGSLTSKETVDAIRTIAITHISQLAFAGIVTAYKNTLTKDQSERDNNNFHLLAETIVGPAPVLLGPALHDSASGIHDLGTRGLAAVGMDITPSHDYTYGYSLLPVEAVYSSGKATVLGFKAGLGLVNGEDVPVNKWLDVAITASKGPIPLTRTTTPLLYAARDVLDLTKGDGQ